MAAVGLNIPISIITSLIGGLTASFIAFKLCQRQGLDERDFKKPIALEENYKKTSSQKIIPLLFKGGEEGLEIVLKTIPTLIIALLFVNILRAIGLIDILEIVMSPILTKIGIPGIAVLPIVTKFIAGGTAMMAIILDLVNEGAITVSELNRIAGFTLNPLDPVGLAVLMATGPRVEKIAKPAIIAAVIGIILKSILHLIIF